MTVIILSELMKQLLHFMKQIFIILLSVILGKKKKRCSVNWGNLCIKTQYSCINAATWGKGQDSKITNFTTKTKKSCWILGLSYGEFKEMLEWVRWCHSFHWQCWRLVSTSVKKAFMHTHDWVTFWVIYWFCFPHFVYTARSGLHRLFEAIDFR